ncbi:MAG: hypothetical protein FJZ98_10060 [Chloroflexi bacterium]|nr:hypothetical protein [Chloroflexota bacterium]
MAQKPTTFNYFEPVDRIAAAQFQEINQISDSTVRDFRQHFLGKYETGKFIDPKQKEWKKLISQKAIENLRFAENPTITEFASPQMPGSHGEFAGVATIEEEHLSYWIREDIRRKDVRFCHFDKAIHEQVFSNDRITQLKKSQDRDRFSLLTLGASKHSLCVSIPDDLVVEEPFLIRIANQNGPLIMPVIINVRAGKRSTIKLIIEISSPGKELLEVILPIELHVFAEESSSLAVLENQQTNLNTHIFSNQQFFLEEAASLNYLLIDRGGEIVKRNIKIHLEGENAAAELTALYTPSGKQKYIFDTHQNHLASNTMSNLLFKGVMDDDSYSLWKGNVYVAKETQGVDGYQMNNNLMMNPSAQAESIPGLEILADDVKCSHGVTISDIDEDQIFYLKSRGIEDIAGKKLIVDGFTQDALRRIGSVDLRDYAKKELGFNEEF